MLHLTIDPEDQRTCGPCACCGNMTQRVWGYVYDGDVAIAAYFVEWTPGHIGKAANFDLVIGKWGPESSQADRQGVALAFRHLENGPEFMVIDASQRPFATSPIVGEAMSRECVVGKAIAEAAFAICDTIYLQDHRLSTVLSA